MENKSHLESRMTDMQHEGTTSLLSCGARIETRAGGRLWGNLLQRERAGVLCWNLIATGAGKRFDSTCGVQVLMTGMSVKTSWEQYSQTI